MPRPEFADIEVVREWIEQKHIRGVVFAGQGRHFSAGADLKYFNQLCAKDYIDEFNAGKALLNYMENIEKPIIASIDGVCLGGGLEIALACHMRYCSEKAVFGFPEINHGIIPGLGGVERLVKTVGRAKAMELLLTGDTFNSLDALSIGIVNGIVHPSNSFSQVMEIMKKIVESAEKPVTYCIRAINNSGKKDFAYVSLEESKMFGDLVIEQYGGLS